MTREEVIRLAQQYCDYSSDSKGRESFEFDDYGLYHFAQLLGDVAALELRILGSYLINVLCDASGLCRTPHLAQP